MERFYQNSEKIFREIFQEINHPIGLLPSDTLYHYTDLIGFIGIIESQTLFSSNIGFVNDTKELLYGKGMIINTLSELKQSFNDIIRPEILEGIISNLEIMVSPEFYVTCFSKERDLLSLWRGYSEKGQGIAIGFPKNLINNISQGLKERNIVYDSKIQQEIIKDLFFSSIKLLKEKKEIYNLSEGQYEFLIFKSMLVILFEEFLSFKDNSFQEEKEYRYIYNDIYSKDNNAKVHFRTNHKIIIPYVKLEPYKGKLLPIQEIVVGPSKEGETLNRGITLILEENGYKSVPITNSKVPFRN